MAAKKKSAKKKSAMKKGSPKAKAWGRKMAAARKKGGSAKKHGLQGYKGKQRIGKGKGTSAKMGKKRPATKASKGRMPTEVLKLKFRATRSALVKRAVPKSFLENPGGKPSESEWKAEAAKQRKARKSK